MRNYLPPPHKFRPKTLDSTDTVDFTHFRRTVNRYCVIQVYKIMHGIDKVDKDKFFTVYRYSATRGHSLKLFKKRSRLLVRANSFSNRVVDSWNSLTEDIVNAPSLNAFKSRLKRFWRGHPYKFSPSCYSPGQHTRDRTQNQNASEEANGPD